MRHRPAFRLLSALLGFWFLVAGQEPPFAHPCFMAPGGAPPIPATASGYESPTAAHAHAHGGGQADAHDHGPPSSGAPASDAPAECECIGDCGALAPMPTVPLARLAIFVPEEMRVVPAPLVAHVARVPAAPPRLQPYANGPPEAA
jgi:hypothetical protein